MTNYKELCKCINNEYEQEECLFCKFIKDLKEELKYGCDDRECEICKNQDEVINKLIAGDELK